MDINVRVQVGKIVPENYILWSAECGEPRLTYTPTGNLIPKRYPPDDNPNGSEITRENYILISFTFVKEIAQGKLSREYLPACSWRGFSFSKNPSCKCMVSFWFFRSTHASRRIIGHDSEIPLPAFFIQIQVKTLGTPNNFILHFTVSEIDYIK